MTLRATYLGLLLALFGLGFWGCEESVDPVLETSRPYTLYGYLNPKADTQAVRVFGIEGTLAPSPGQALGADFTSQALPVAGGAMAWRDSVVSYRNGTFGNIYWAPFRADFGATYRLNVVDAEGQTATVTVDTPPDVAPIVGTTEVQPGFVETPILWPGAPRLLDIIVLYRIQIVLPNGDLGEQFDLPINYSGRQERTADGWVVKVDMLRDIDRIVQFLFVERFSFRAIALAGLEMSLLVTNEAWYPPGGTFDPELLVEPGTFTNVENGFGFVGGGYPTGVAWLPPEEVIRQAGFVPVPED